MRRSLDRFCVADAALCLRCNRCIRHPAVLVWFRTVSRLGDGVFWYALMLGLVLADPDRGPAAALHMACAGGTGTLIYKWLKGKTSRPRPFAVHQSIEPGCDPLDHFSFPSGHTLHATAFSWVAIAWYPGLAWMLVPFTLMVALSRPVLGLHYPSDVMAGALLGGLIGWLSLLI